MGPADQLQRKPARAWLAASASEAGPAAAALGRALRQGEKESSGLERKWAARKEMEWAAAAGLRAEKKKEENSIFFQLLSKANF